MKKTFSIISLGCPRNLVDSEHIVSEFKNKGFIFKEDPMGTDTVIINTCSFIEDAKKESIDIILKVIDAKKHGDINRIVVAGCLPERYPEELKNEFKEIDEFRGVLDFNRVPEKKTDLKLTPGRYAYIKISEGCLNRCAYCIIPYLKGPYRSRPFASIIKEADSLINKNLKEIILIGQDTSIYGIDRYGRKRLGELLKKLSAVSGDRWLRLLYCHPSNLDRNIIDIIKNSANICKYIDLPIEHINDTILNKMNRKSEKKDIVALIEYIRGNIKDAAIRTSIIVGFPGETEKHFQELLSFVKETRFERLGLFKYSREENTPAFRFKNHISEKEKQRRFDEIMRLQQAVSEDINKKFIGKRLRVLIEEKEEELYIGRTEYDAPEVDGSVYVKGKNLKIGDFYNVSITDTYEYDLMGETEEV
jgi:ribosomal protein S12 methylthiotransferase